MKCIRLLFVATLLAALCACTKSSGPADSRGNNSMSKTSEERRAATHQLLREHGIPFHPKLPFVEDAETVRLRDADDVARRCLVLCSVAAAAQGRDRFEIIAWLRDSQLWSELTPRDLDFLESAAPSMQDRVDATWRIEAAMMLLWALGSVDVATVPTTESDVGQVLEQVPGPGEEVGAWIASAELRSSDEILDRLDLVYHQHWATRQASLDHEPPPANLNSDVIQEWHHALNWLTMHPDGAEWDDVTTDT